MNFYSVGGLTIASECLLPELMPCLQTDVIDVEICFGTVPDTLQDSEQASQETEISSSSALIKIPGIARYRVFEGNRILIQTESKAKDSDVRLFLLGSALGAIYLQRGYFPLHASVVVINGRAIAFAGPAGAGKSTLAAWLLAQGYPLLSDDVCVVRFDKNLIPLAYPGFPRVKIWADAAEALEINVAGLAKDYSRAEKYLLPVSKGFWTEPAPLSHIYFLEYSDSSLHPVATPIPAAKAVALMRDNTYRFQYISSLKLTSSHFRNCVRLVNSTCVKYLTRPHKFSALAMCQSIIENETA